MKKIAFVFVAIMLIGLLSVTACQTAETENHTPIPVKDIGVLWAEQEAPDDIMPVPGGGPAYRANVHQQDEENPWPAIEVSEAYLGSGSDEAHIYYRSHIETEAGETRNNVIKVIIPSKEVNSLTLYADNVPQDITLTDGMQWSGPGAKASVLVIEIASDMALGEYTLEIGLEINDKDYGTITCTIEVVRELYQGNHGITTTKIEPKPGENVTMSSALMVRLTLDDLVAKSDAIVIGKVVDILPARSGTEPLWSSYLQVFTDVIIETERYLYGEPQSAYIAVRVTGGRAGEIVMWVEDEPVFNLGEAALLFLTRVPQPNSPPEGIVSDYYYRVTGAMQGKLGYLDSQAVNLGGESFTVSEIEQKIASIHGSE